VNLPDHDVIYQLRENGQLPKTVSSSANTDFGNSREESDSDPEDESELMEEFLQEMEEARGK